MGVPLRGGGVPSVGTGMAGTGGSEGQHRVSTQRAPSLVGPERLQSRSVFILHTFSALNMETVGTTSTCQEKAEDKYIHAAHSHLHSGDQ